MTKHMPYTAIGQYLIAKILNIFETSKKKVEKFRGADHTSVIDEGSTLTEVTMK